MRVYQRVMDISWDSLEIRGKFVVYWDLMGFRGKTGNTNENMIEYESEWELHGITI